MTGKPYIDHRLIQKWREKSKEAGALLASPATLAAFEKGTHPVTLAEVPHHLEEDYMGYLASADGRIILRFVDDDEALRLFGVLGVRTQEAISLVLRFSNLKGIEDAAMEMQRDIVVIRRALADIAGNPAIGPIAQAKARKALDDTARE